jgi:hypothetical protein
MSGPIITNNLVYYEIFHYSLYLLVFQFNSPLMNINMKGGHMTMLHKMIIIKKFPLAPMGILAPGSAHARPSARPHIATSGNFLAHVSAESPSNISPNQKSYPKFQNPRTNFAIFNQKNFKKPKNDLQGVSEFFGVLISPFLFRINPL